MPSCENKVCKDNKICNPNTGRCNKPKKRTISCADKICPSGKVCNPQTIRCKKMIQKTKLCTQNHSSLSNLHMDYSNDFSNLNERSSKGI